MPADSPRCSGAIHSENSVFFAHGIISCVLSRSCAARHGVAPQVLLANLVLHKLACLIIHGQTVELGVIRILCLFRQVIPQCSKLFSVGSHGSLRPFLAELCLGVVPTTTAAGMSCNCQDCEVVVASRSEVSNQKNFSQSRTLILQSNLWPLLSLTRTRTQPVTDVINCSTVSFGFSHLNVSCNDRSRVSFQYGEPVVKRFNKCKVTHHGASGR